MSEMLLTMVWFILGFGGYIFIHAGVSYYRDMTEMKKQVIKEFKDALKTSIGAKTVFTEAFADTEHARCDVLIAYLFKQFADNLSMDEKRARKRFQMTGELTLNLYAVVPISEHNTALRVALQYFDLLFTATFWGREVKHDKGLLPTIKFGISIGGYAYDGIPNKESIEYFGYSKELLNRLMAQAACANEEYEQLREKDFPKNSFTMLHVPITIASKQ